MFEPKESEPFTLQTVCTIKPSKQISKEENNCKDTGYTLTFSFFFFIIRSSDFQNLLLNKKDIPLNKSMIFF